MDGGFDLSRHTSVVVVVVWGVADVGEFAKLQPLFLLQQGSKLTATPRRTGPGAKGKSIQHVPINRPHLDPLHSDGDGFTI